MQPKRIYFILPSLDAGGAEKIVSTLCNHLDRKIFAPTLVLFQKKGFYLDYLAEDVPVIDLKVERIRYAAFRLIPLLAKHKPDIVFAGWGEVAAYLGPFVPFLGTSRFLARETNVVSQHVTRKSIRFLYKFLNNFHHIIAQSSDMQMDLQKTVGINPDKITKINNPVDFDFIDQKLKAGANFQYPNPHKKQIVGIGNVSYRKGFDNLIKSFSFLPKEKYQLNIVGDGPDLQAFEELVQELGLQDAVQFWGQQRNAIQFLKAADLFVLSSRYEGFPNVLLEAGACGTYSLANDCKGGIREIITPANGQIGDVEDHKAFAKTMEKVLEKEVNPDAIRASIEERYALPLIIHKFETVLGRL